MFSTATRFITLAATAALQPIKPAIQPLQADWCASESVPDHPQSDLDATVLYVRPHKLRSAISLLHRASIYQMRPALIREYTGRSAEPGFNYYLSRSSIYAADSAGLPDLDRMRHEAKIVVKRLDGEASVVLVTLQPTGAELVKARDFPVVLKTRLILRRAYVGCFAVR